MEIIEQTPFNDFNITACDGYQCEINQKIYQSSFLLYQNQIIPWPIKSIADINASTLQPIIDLAPECVIIGTGVQFHFIEAQDLIPLIEAHIGYECMKTLTACGSYQLLAGDGRKVLAAIILEEPPKD